MWGGLSAGSRSPERLCFVATRETAWKQAGGGIARPTWLASFFPEPENFKCCPPVTIVDNLSRHFLIPCAGGEVLQRGPVAWKISERCGVRHKHRARIGDDLAEVFGVAQTHAANRYGLIAEELQRFEDAPIDHVHLGRPQPLEIAFQRINGIGPPDVGTGAYQFPIVFVGDEN